ncbi:MFS transporter [Sphingosinicella sp. CPCC 101087]|uniref:MFS transporter n=1 Tax=Sphingosinicella sp. CPCC 101087 TaxID=2497754 RepID=UPI00101BBD87|nr:MFS transporter [Sphingosinicella sp. CPCC 101087]
MASVAADTAPSESGRTRMVIAASSAGTVFEWYDFFIYGTLAASGIIGRTFFPAGNETLQTLLAWAGFAVGFGFRPLGAILFGYMGDRLGRKYTFLITITLMGLATAGVGLVPSAAAIGIAAPVLIILLRILQGLALGGEYGGAAIYVAEHSPPGRAGFYTSFVQASVGGGFVLSLAVVLGTKMVMSEADWDAWGWRVPFLISILLLAISLWMRFKLSESPVFTAMKESGGCTANPFKESFTYPGNRKRLFVALFGIAAGLTVVWYTAMFSTLSFLQGTMRVEGTTAQLIVGAGALGGLGWFVLFGRLSDRVGRKKPIVIGYALTLMLLFPIFWVMGSAANPEMEAAAARAPVRIERQSCEFDPFARRQADLCGRVIGELAGLGVRYQFDLPAGKAAPAVEPLVVRIGGETHVLTDTGEIRPLLEAAGYRFEPVVPSAGNVALLILAMLAITALSGMTYGPVAALLSEMFPPRIRYSSMSIPYHFGTGYFGGFLPFIASYIVATTGDPYSGLWYTWGVVAMALIVTWLWLPDGVEHRASGAA